MATHLLQRSWETKGIVATMISTRLMRAKPTMSAKIQLEGAADLRDEQVVEECKGNDHENDNHYVDDDVHVHDRS